jgi:thiol-disulfide isomerase/thioredoxin
MAAVLALAPLPALAKSKALPKTFELKGLDGGALNPADVKGKRLVLQFFASWCVGCADVMAELAPLVKEQGGARFVPVSVDETISEARDYFKKQKDTVKPLRKVSFHDADAKLATALDVEALPAVLVVDDDGKVLLAVTGHPTVEQVAQIRRLVAK